MQTPREFGILSCLWDPTFALTQFWVQNVPVTRPGLWFLSLDLQPLHLFFQEFPLDLPPKLTFSKFSE